MTGTLNSAIVALGQGIMSAAGAPEGKRPVYACPVCKDTGMVVEETPPARPGKGPDRRARRCACQLQKAAAKRLERAGIPRRYTDATLAGFRTAGVDGSIAVAHRLARGIAERFPVLEGASGLLLTGSAGIGKTHLACALLRELVTQRGASGRFWDCGDLLVQIKRSFLGGSAGRGEEARSEASLLDEVSAVDVLVLDELGPQRGTEWSFDELGIILGARYNANRLTIVTSNYPNLGPGAGTRGMETLGDKIGARMHSRLQQMCRPVEMMGQDFRMRRER